MNSIFRKIKIFAEQHIWPWNEIRRIRHQAALMMVEKEFWYRALVTLEESLLAEKSLKHLLSSRTGVKY